jgi:type IV pilus assembly protein PilC
MLKFKYKGFDTVKGKKVNGYMEGYVREEIIYKLKENDIECEESDVYEIDEDSFEYKMDKLLNKDISNPVKRKHILTFTEQLSMHLSAKLPVSEALGTMAKDATNKVLAKLYQDLYEDTVKGLDLSDALKKHPAFDNFFLTIIRSGEQSGQLDVSLRSLNTYMKTNDRLKNRIIFSSIYPLFLICTMIAGLVLMSIYVIPKFQKIFTDSKVQLNGLTKFYFALADLIRFHPLPLLIGAIIIVSAIVYFFKTSNVKVAMIRDYIELKNPIYNKFIKDRQISQFAYTLSILLKNGIILTDALEMSKSMFKNKYVSDGLNKMHKNLMQGNNLNKELKDFKIHKKQFLPMLFVQLATVGDATGNLEEPFMKAGEYFLTLFDNKATTFEKLIEPIMLLALIPPVFTFVLAIFVPMISMGQAL